MPVSSLVLVACPLCGAQEDFFSLPIPHEDVHIQKYGPLYEGVSISEWKSCGRCGFVHQNPRPPMAALSAFYREGRYHPPDVPSDVAAYLRFADWYFNEKVDYAVATSGLSGGTVLEIGCGLGGALRLFGERGWMCIGVEPDPAQARFAQE